MPKFIFTSPDGKKYTGTAPNGATQDDVLAYVQKQIMTQQPMSMADRAVPNKDVSDTESLPIDREYQPGQAYSRSKFESSVPGMALRGAEFPALKLGELLPSSAVTDPYKQYVQDIKDYQRAGQSLQSEDEKRAGSTASAVGSLVSALPIGKGISQLGSTATGAIPAISRVLANTAAGGAIAGLHPGSTWKDTGMGALIAGGLTGGYESGRGIKNFIQNRFGPETVSGNWLRERVGANYVDEAATLARTPSPIAGYPATAAEKMVGLPVRGAETSREPAGTAIQALQKQVEAKAGGVSSDFMTQRLAQEKAIQSAKKFVDTETAPLRTKAYDAIRQQGGVSTTELLNDIQRIGTSRDVSLLPGAQNAISKIRDTIMQAQGEHRRVDPEALHKMRREMGKTIEGIWGSDNGRPSKDSIAVLSRSVQKSIDDAMERSGGASWKQYLTDYAQKMTPIDKVSEALALQYNPLVKTSLGSGMESESFQHVLPDILSRPVTGVKWLAKLYGPRMERKIDEYLSKTLRNPDQLADVLQAPSSPYNRQLGSLLNQGIATGMTLKPNAIDLQ